MRLAVFTKNYTNPAYAAARVGAERAAAVFGAEVVHFVPAQPDDAVEQVALIDAALATHPDGIVLSPVHPTLVDPALLRIQAAGIPLIGFVNRIRAVPCVAYVGSDDHRLAVGIAQYLFSHLGGVGRVLIVTGHEHSVTSLARVKGFEDAAREAPGIGIAGYCVGDYSRAVARAAVAAWLDAHEAPDAYLVANDIMAIGVLDVLRARGLTAPVVGVNAIPDAIEEIRGGGMLATADFNAMQMAGLATECAVRHLRGEAVPKDIELPVRVVDRANCERWALPYVERPILTLKELDS